MTTHLRFVSLARVAEALALPRIATWERREDGDEALDRLDRKDALEARVDALPADIAELILAVAEVDLEDAEF
jgi:hypothetical protein